VFMFSANWRLTVMTLIHQIAGPSLQICAVYGQYCKRLVKCDPQLLPD
jgi:hypothetical protein